MVESYQWIKAMHLISVFAWMAGMLYLPRLFVYHCAAAPGSEMSETFKVMERRLLRGIVSPFRKWQLPAFTPPWRCWQKTGQSQISILCRKTGQIQKKLMNC